MNAFKLIAQHYDMAPGTIVYQVNHGRDLYTVNKDVPGEPYLRIVPAEKVEQYHVSTN